MVKVGRLLANTALLTLALASAAQAGGFQRGTADTDVVYEGGDVVFRSGLTYVNPERGFESINGDDGDFGTYTGTYNIPSFALGANSEMFGCAVTYTESFAAEADYTGSPGGALPPQNASTASTDNDDRLDLASATVTSRTRSINFDSDEFGATCRVSYPTEMGRFSLLGGVFFEDFEFQGSSLGNRNLNAAFGGTPIAAVLGAAGASVILPTEVNVDSRGDYQTGYRIGLAYEMPELALRVQGLYRSEIEHDDISGDGSVTITDTAFVQLANGTQVSIPVFFGAAVPGPGGAALAAGASAGLAGRGLVDGAVIPVDSTLNTATSPQSFTINAQTGIAEGTLLLASLRWTDWSTNEVVVSSISGSLNGVPIASSSFQPYQWRDGYTASLGLGRAFNEFISGAVSVGYDRGVSTGADTTYTDLYTLSGGLSFKDNKFAELRVGGLVGYWTDGEQRIGDGAYFNADVGDDWVYGANASVKFNF